MMGGFGGALRSDLHVALRSRGLHVLLCLPPAAAGARIVLGKLQAAGEQAQRILAGKSPAASTELTAYAALVDGLSVGLILGYLVMVALAAHAVASGRDLGVIRHVLIRRASRRSVLVATFASVTMVGAALAVLVFLASWGSAALLHDFTAVVEDGYEIIGTTEMRGEILLGLTLALAPLPAAIAFGILLSVCARSATQAVAIALGATIAFDLFKGLLGTAAPYIYAFHHPSIIDGSYLKDVARLVRGYSDVFVEEGMHTLNLLVPLPQALAFLGLALVVVTRKKM
jgi:ABC-type transport system involved in multi-copper enzyme maturation permease subunit